MIVELSDEAEHDLEAIGDYIARDNPVRVNAGRIPGHRGGVKAGHW